MEKDNRIADLHIHTRFSDGEHSPHEIVEKAIEHGISAISITDHDTADGSIIAEEIATKAGLGYIHGIELSTFHNNKEWHILGYGIDPQNPSLTHHIEETKVYRMRRAEKMWEKLRTLGITFPFEDIMDKAGKTPITRPLIANVIFEKGYTTSVKQAFTRYVGDFRPAYVEKIHFPVSSAVKLIHKAGGIASLAHPMKMLKQKILYEFVSYGLDAIEIIHPTYNDRLRIKITNMAKDYKLIYTGGSDYHGGERQWDEMNFGNIVIPYEMFVNLKEKVKEFGR